MSKVLRVDPSVADAWVQKDLGAPQPDFWVTIEAYFPADAIAELVSSGGGWLISLFLPDGTTDTDAVGISGGEWSTYGGSPGGTPGPAGAWLTLELHHVTSDAGEFDVDGVEVTTSSDFSGGFDSQNVRVGLWNGFALSPSLFYVRRVKVGTTRGGNDLADDDFSSGDLSYWTTMSGDVSVVDDPTPAGPFSVTFDYDGESTARAIVTGAELGAHYIFYVPGSSFTTGTQQEITADVSSFILTIPDIAGTDGDIFGLFFERTDSSPITGTGALAAAACQLGHAGGPFPFQPGVLAWDYDGDKQISVTFDTSGTPGPVPLGSFVTATAYTGDGSWPPDGYTQGSTSGPYDSGVQTVTFDLADSPAAGMTFAVALEPSVGDHPYPDFFACRMFIGGTPGSGFDTPFATPYGAAPITPSILSIKIYDLATTELADITDVALDPVLTGDLSQARTLRFRCPANDSRLTDVAGDSIPNLNEMDRKILFWENGLILFHGRIDTLEWDGDENSQFVTVTALMPLATELGYEGNDRAGRIVRGSTTQPTAGDPYGEYDGNFINPKFASSVADQDGISGPDLILQVLTNSQNTGAEIDPSPGEGPLPMSLAGDFDLAVPDAIDLSPSQTMDWPQMIGDFIQQLAATGVCDVFERPVDPTEGLGPFVMSEVNAKSAWGTDKSDTVHFDYWTGDHNAKAAKVVANGGTLNNKLYHYLGPAQPGGTRWKSNITPTGAPFTAAITASRNRYGGPGDDKGQFMQIRAFDSTGTESDSRPLYKADWTAEQKARLVPRRTLFVTPHTAQAGLFTAPQDFDVGDVIGINIANLGPAVAATQRVYGWTKQWDRQGFASLAQLRTSADAPA